MTTITTRAGKGSPLTNNEVDANFTNLSNDNQPDVRPSLLLDFANSKTLDPRITFTRGSTATYWDGKTTTKAEENLFTHSQDIVAGKWNIIQLGVVDDQTAPDGTSTAQLFTPNTSSNYHYVYAGNSPTTTATSTFSVYAKNNGANYAFLRSNSSSGYCGVNFDLSNSGSAAVEGSGNIDSYSATDVGNGWYRLTVTFNKNLSSQTQLLINGDSSSVAEVWTGNGTDGIYFWGAQLEQRSSATAYTETDASPIVKYQPTLQTAASGEARFDHDPVTGESKGLLIEEARTNSLTFSEEFDHSSFTEQSVTVEANQAVAPDGTLTADKLVIDSGAGTHQITKLGVISSQTCSVSIFAKAAGVNTFTLLDGAAATNGASFNLSTGVATDVNSGTGTIENLGNGWYRCTAVMTTTGFRLYCPDAAGTSVGDGFNGIFIWGAQVEAGSFPTSYIPTSGSTVTRSIDSAVVEGTAFTDAWRDDEVTVYASGTANTNRANNTNLLTITSTASNVNNRAGWSFRTGTGSDEMLIDNFYAYGSAVSDYADDAYPYAKVAYRFKNSDFAWTVNYPDNPLFTDSVTTGYGPAKNKLYIGATYNGTAKSTTIEKIAFYPVGLSNATLQAMTEE